MRLPSLLFLAGLAACTGTPPGQRPAVVPGPVAATPQVLLPNGWQLSPAGQQVPLGDLPLNLQVAPNGKLAAVVNCGYGPNSVQLLDAATGAVLDTQPVRAAWVGLAFGPDGTTLYASGGQANRIHCFRVAGQRLVPDSALVLGQPWPKQKIGVGGLALDARRQLLYAVTREDSALYVLDLRTRAEWMRFREDTDLPRSKGFLAYQEAVCKPKGFPVSGAVRFAVFDTDDYDTRVYAFENDVFSAVSIPGFAGRGSRMYVNLMWRINKQWRIEGRGETTYLSKSVTTGTTAGRRTVWKLLVQGHW